MNLDKRDQLITKFYSDALEMVKRKGRDYEPGGEAFANLLAEAKELGVHPMQFLLVHMSKHWAALRSYVRKGNLLSEDIEGRLIDIANYAALFHCLILLLRDKDYDNDN